MYFVILKLFFWKKIILKLYKVKTLVTKSSLFFKNKENPYHRRIISSPTKTNNLKLMFNIYLYFIYKINQQHFNLSNIRIDKINPLNLQNNSLIS